ncbi:hypothetical protein K8S19_11805 [bacterium]|nr:hypothetical protein [bacterium]
MGRKIKIRATGERKQFILGLAIFMGIYLLSYIWVMFVMPIASTSAGSYALISFSVGILASVFLIFSRHSVMGLGGSLAAILYVVFFAVTWPLVR